MLMLHEPPAATSLPQLLVSENGCPPGLVSAMNVIGNARVLVSFNVMESGALATLSAWGANVSELEDTEKEGVAPVPLRATVCVARPLALMLKVAETGPETAGSNTTWMLQLAPTAMEVPQLLVWENG
jgi:hypothetical protein